VEKNLHQILPFIDIRRHEKGVDHFNTQPFGVSDRHMIAETRPIEIHPETGRVFDENHVGSSASAGDNGDIGSSGNHAPDPFGGRKRNIRHKDEDRAGRAPCKVIVERLIEPLLVDTGPGTGMMIFPGAEDTGAASRLPESVDDIPEHDPGECFPLLLVHDI